MKESGEGVRSLQAKREDVVLRERRAHRGGRLSSPASPGAWHSRAPTVEGASATLGSAGLPPPWGITNPPLPRRSSPSAPGAPPEQSAHPLGARLMPHHCSATAGSRELMDSCAERANE